MAEDTLTGIKIGSAIYQEGQIYTDASFLQGLLGGLGLGGGVGISGLEAEFDVSRNRLAIFLSGQVSAQGFNPDLDVKLVLDGKAKGKGAVAKDFKAEGLGAGLYAGAGFNTEVIASVETKGLKLKKAFETLSKDPEKLLKKVDISTLAVAAEGGYAGQVAGLLGQIGVSLVPRADAVGPFGADFSGSWWNGGI